MPVSRPQQLAPFGDTAREAVAAFLAEIGIVPRGAVGRRHISGSGTRRCACDSGRERGRCCLLGGFDRAPSETTCRRDTVGRAVEGVFEQGQRVCAGIGLGRHHTRDHPPCGVQSAQRVVELRREWGRFGAVTTWNVYWGKGDRAAAQPAGGRVEQSHGFYASERGVSRLRC